MKNITVLVDTNVLLDYLTTRKPYFDEEYAILLMCVEEKINGYVAEISADYIITSNISDYQKYVFKAITPKQFLDITGQL